MWTVLEMDAEVAAAARLYELGGKNQKQDNAYSQTSGADRDIRILEESVHK